MTKTTIQVWFQEVARRWRIRRLEREQQRIALSLPQAQRMAAHVRQFGRAEVALAMAAQLEASRLRLRAITVQLRYLRDETKVP